MKQLLMAGALACTFAAQLPALAQTATPQQPASPSAIPDAPRPQTSIGPVTPGIGSTSTSANSPDADDDQASVGSSLPGSKPQEAPDVDVAPDLPGQGQAPQTFDRLVLQSNFVDVPFTVKDSKGQLVPGLTWRDVRVYENGVRQHMAVFTQDSFPLSVALVIDQSMPHDTMTAVNNALGAIPTAFSKYDEVAVYTYNNGPKLQDGFTSGQSARLTAVIERAKTTGRDAVFYDSGTAMSKGIYLNGGAQANLTPLTANGPGSPQGVSHDQVPREVHTLNDAIFMAAQSLVKVGPDRRRVIYVISDGKEYGSQIKQKELIHYLQQNKIAVYATLVGDSALSGMGFIDKYHLPLMMRDNVLPVFTAATGGQYYAEYRTKGIETSFAKITEQVRTQYTVGYYSREPFIDGKYRQLEVRVLRPNLQVIAKKGYYPSAQALAPPRPATPAATSSSNQ